VEIMRLISIAEGQSRRSAKRLRVHIEGTLRELNGRSELAFAAKAAAKHRRRYDLAAGRPNNCHFTLAANPGDTPMRLTVSFPARLVPSPEARRILRSASKAYRRLAPTNPPLVPVRDDAGLLVSRLIAAEIRQAGETDAPWAAAVSALQRNANLLRRVADQLIEDGLAQP
jgi:hypothetical protein